MYKAVIVDDEDIIVRGLREIMPWSKYDCKVVGTACNGDEAMELIRREVPDILFTDINMPHTDGLAMMEAIRKEFPNMEITILSGYSEFDYAKRAIKLGVTRYVVKPSKLEELEEALGTMVEAIHEKEAVEAIQRQILEQNKHQNEAQPEAEDEINRLKEEGTQNFIINHALKFIEEHYAEKLTLAEVAKNVYVSQWHLSKLISKNTNQSFSDILNKIRIEHAKELLSNPGKRIWEISDAVGFADVTHFSRIFKKYEGMSANEYRNRQNVR